MRFVLACFVVLGCLAVAGCGNSDTSSGTSITSTSTSTTATAADADAVSYIESLGDDTKRVQTSVQTVQVAVGLLQKSSSQANLNQVAQLAQSAHDNIDNIRNDFANTTTDSGTLGDAELAVFDSAEGLKNAMGALVTYTGTPNAATLASFKTQYATATGEWNSGVRTIWRLARMKEAPTV